MRGLIVNADDFGQTAGINHGVITCIERGIVTSASLMVRWPASFAAAEYVRQHPTLSVGLHVDLGEWMFRDETWTPVYTVLSSSSAADVRTEITRQVQTFRALTSRDPTHLDSHQHAHREEPVRSLLTEMAMELGIPLRNVDPRVRYDGSFYGQSGNGYPVPEAISVEHLVQLIEALPAGLTELGCHPGDADRQLATMYALERAQEVRVLCDPRVRRAINAANIMLCSFHVLQGMMLA